MDNPQMMFTALRAGPTDAPRKPSDQDRRGPPPAIGPNDALLLDLDGTLLELANTPELVWCPPDLPALLDELTKVQAGALAIVSGRNLGCIDELLKPLRVAGAGIYGAELRLRPEGPTEVQEIPEIAVLARRLTQRFHEDPRILIENKGCAVAIHFRLAPERADECRKSLIAEAPCPPLKIVEGKCVVEACPAAHDKGLALQRIMAAEPFRGRRPIFVGDDRSDEVAFQSVSHLGGYGIKVGPGRTVARYRLQSVVQVRDWLSARLVRKEAAPP